MSKPTQEDIELAKATEKQLDLPDGALVGFVAEGGKLDGRARAKVREAYGIDAKLNRRNTIEATGLALQDALSDNAGDASKAIAELHSGADRAKWNKATTTFASRALGTRAADGSYLGNRPVAPAAAPQMTGQRSASGTSMTRPVGNRSASGMTDPRAPAQPTPAVPSTDYGTEQSVEPEQTMASPDTAQPVAAGESAAMATMTSPTPGPVASPASAGEPEGPVAAGPKTLAAYADGTMPEEQRRKFEQYVKDGGVTVPDGFKLGETAAPTTLDRAISAPGRALDAVGNAITGNDRKTPETQAAEDWSKIPEWEDLSTLTNVAALSANPKEALQVLSANIPGVKVRTDEKGNLFAFSPKAGKEFVVTPGLTASDVPRFGVNALWALASGGGSVAAQVGKGAATQALVEGGQSVAGGSFDPGDIALAGAAPLAAPILGAAARGSRGAANALLDAVPGSTTRQLAGAATDAASTIVDDPAAAAVRAAAAPVDDVTKVVPPPVGAVDDVTKVVPPPASAAAPSVAPAAAAPAAAPAVDLPALFKAAGGTGEAAEAAKRALAQQLEVNPAAVAAAERLGLELPVDVLADSKQMQSIIGSLRSKSGTAAETAFADSMEAAVKQTDDLVRELGGDASPGAISDRVLSSLQSTQGELKAQASKLYQKVDEAIKPASPVRLDKVSAALQERVTDLGGDVSLLNPIEQKLLKLATNPKATYEAMREQKALIGKALARQESPYASMDDRILKRLYGAMADDQLANIERLGGAELRQQARLANQLTAKQKGLEERIVKTFGKEGDGSVAALMQNAIRGASKGDVKRLNQLLKVVPKEMQGDVIMTALSSMSRATRGAAGGEAGFGFAEFSKLYQGLRAPGNEAIYKTVDQALGPKRAAVLRDVYEISKRITQARANVKTTGKANQDFLDNLAAENLVGAVINGPLGQRAARAVGVAGGAAVGGPAGAAVGGEVAASILSKIAGGGEEQIAKAGQLLVSPEFKTLAVELATKAAPSKEVVRAVIASKPFRDWAKAAMLSREPKALEQWVMAAIQGARGPTTEAVTREAR